MKVLPPPTLRVTELRSPFHVSVLTPKTVPHVSSAHIAPIRVSVAEAIEEVRKELRRRKRATFRDLSRSAADRLNLIVRFLAVLELVKRGEADVAQSGTFGTIEVLWLGERAGRTIALDEYDGTMIDDDSIQLDAPVIDLDGDTEVAPEAEGDR